MYAPSNDVRALGACADSAQGNLHGITPLGCTKILRGGEVAGSGALYIWGGSPLSMLRWCSLGLTGLSSWPMRAFASC